MTEKQLAQSVHNGRLITVVFADREVCGYLMGWDDQNLLVVEPNCVQQLISRAAIVSHRLHTESTLAGETNRSILEECIDPFRRWVRSNVLCLGAHQ